MKTYDEILESMKSKYVELSGNDVPEFSDIDIRLKVLAGEIYKEQVNLEFVKNQMFVRTATGEYLDYHAADRGLSRKAAVKAKGKVRFTLAAALEVDLNIPRGTIVATSGSEPHRYCTDSDAVIAAGKTTATVACTAEQGGADSNVVVGAVNILVTTITGIEIVKNTVAFTGGTDVESDESLRERITESYNTISNGTNKAYYKSLALSVAGVTDAAVVPKVRGVGTVDVYICNNKSAASTSLIAQVQAIMDTAREVNVDVLVASATIVPVQLGVIITVADNYDAETVKGAVSLAITDYVNSLGIGESIIENYIGKVVLGVEGVHNYSFSSFYPSAYDIELDSLAVVDSITVEEE